MRAVVGLLALLTLLGGLAGCDRLVGLKPRPIDANEIESTYADAVLADTPIAYWRFGANSLQVAADTSGQNPGIYRGQASPTASGALLGDSDPALALDGDGDFVDMADRLAFEGHAPFTIELWAQRTTLTGYVGVISKSDEQSGGLIRTGYQLFSDGESLGFERSGEASIRQDVRTAPLQEGRWTYLAVTYDGAVLRLYVDAALQAISSTPAVAIPPTTNAFVIGGRNGGQHLFFAGAVDEVALYDRALELAALERHRAAALGL
ncbi:MAG: LamG domain-containing protein [Deltaproteobacteria bacterium]|nr:LamG domain-containing protein [Deltaproteobacteria bacterium]MDQ3295558.1 LamG domain-containing protein [Myxococcota bacterium]